MQPNDFEELFTVGDFFRYFVSHFQNNIHLGQGCENVTDESIALLCGVLHLENAQFENFLPCRLLERERQALQQAGLKRLGGTPTAYITHEAFLVGYRFFVDSNTIIPRSFIAELLIEELSPWLINTNAPLQILDLCTGQGSLAIIAALHFANATIDAVDISEEALKIAKKNVTFYGLEDRIRLIKSDGFAALQGKKYDIVLCNPPYVNAESMAALPREFCAEPKLALAGGEDGLDFVRPLLKKAKDYLNNNGILIVEIGHNKEIVEKSFHLPFIWLMDDHVFLLNKDDL